jgi:16S rRNA processing protein RimM
VAWSKKPVPTSPKLPDPDGLSGSAPAGAATTVALGRVLGAFGIRGWIKIRPFTESADGLLGQPVWVLSRGGANRVVQVEEAKRHGAFVLAQLKGITDRGQAEALRGTDVTVGRDQLPEPEAGEYYWSDLIGLSVRNVNGVDLGRVAGLIAAPAHDVLRVAAGHGRDQGREQLIPFVEPILREVDLAGGCVTVDWEADY